MDEKKFSDCQQTLPSTRKSFAQTSRLHTTLNFCISVTLAISSMLSLMLLCTIWNKSCKECGNQVGAIFKHAQKLELHFKEICLHNGLAESELCKPPVVPTHWYSFYDSGPYAGEIRGGWTNCQLSGRGPQDACIHMTQFAQRIQ